MAAEQEFTLLYSRLECLESGLDTTSIYCSLFGFIVAVSGALSFRAAKWSLILRPPASRSPGVQLIRLVLFAIRYVLCRPCPIAICEAPESQAPLQLRRRY